MSTPLTTRRLRRRFSSHIGFAALYAVGSVVGAYVFLQQGVAVTPIWPAAGVGLAALLVLGPSAWPAIAVGAAVGQITLHFTSSELNIVFLLSVVAGNALGPLAGVRATQSWHPELLLRGGAQSGIAYLGAALILAGVSTLFGVSGLILTDSIDPSQQSAALLDWFVGDLFGALIFGPLILAVLERARGRDTYVARERELSRRRLSEKVVWVLGLGLSLLVLVVGTVSPSFRLALLAIPAALLNWSGVRFDSLFTTAVCATLAVALIVAIELPLGLPAPDAPGDRIAMTLLVTILCGAPVIFSSIMRRIRSFSNTLRHQNLHDQLTDLPNRRFFDSELNRMLEDAREPIGIGIIDIDNFRLANDRGGQGCGDAYLRHVAVLLDGAVGKDEKLFRLAGDEFGILADGNGFAERMEFLRKAASGNRMAWHTHLVSLQASAGAAVVPPHCTSIEALQAASLACKEAKDRGGDRLYYGEIAQIRGLPQRAAVQWASRINDALENDQFRLYAQIIRPVGKSTRRARLEVLVRLQESDGSIVLPGSFIPVAERFRQIQKIDAWVVEEAIEWLAANIEGLGWLDCVSVNLSGPTISDAGYQERLVELIQDREVPAERLAFEITERVAISDLSAARSFVSRMRGLGCRFALDDFGAGVSSFSYLKALDIDTIKIDGAFIEGMIDDRFDAATVGSVQNMASQLGLVTVAEYVSSQTLLSAVEDLGIDYAQGHALGHAVPLQEFSARQRDNVVRFPPETPGGR